MFYIKFYIFIFCAHRTFVSLFWGVIYIIFFVDCFWETRNFRVTKFEGKIDNFISTPLQLDEFFFAVVVVWLAGSCCCCRFWYEDLRVVCRLCFFFYSGIQPIPVLFICWWCCFFLFMNWFSMSKQSTVIWRVGGWVRVCGMMENVNELFKEFN